MAILFHLTIPRPVSPALDAVVQEATFLQEQMGGEIVYLNPARRPGSRYPERWYGLHRLPYLRRQEKTARLHHLFNPHLRYLPYLRWLRRPIVYTVTAGLRSSQRPAELENLNRLAAIIVSNARDRATLREWELENVHVVRPGIDLSRFTPSPPPAGPGLILLVGSAPWTEAQFRTKGVDALLTAAQIRSDLRLVFLWRGLLYDEMQRRVAQHGLAGRVTVVNRQVDVNQALAGVHAVVVLASDAALVKAFPHSLLEALASGRPVLVSRTLPMADYVQEMGCGQVVEAINARALLEALARLEADYGAQRTAALKAVRRDFAREALSEAYRELYTKEGL